MGVLVSLWLMLSPVPHLPETPRIALVGDSVATSFAPGWMTDHSRPGCGLADGIAQETNGPAKSAWCAATAREHLEAVFATRPDALLVYSTWQINDFRVGERVLAFRSPEWDAWYAGFLDWMRERVPVLLLATVAPRAPIDGIVTTTPRDWGRFSAFNAFHRGYAERHVTVELVDVAGIFCPDDCPEWIGGVRPRPDMGAHFDEAGRAWLEPRLRRVIDAAWERVGTRYATIDGLF